MGREQHPETVQQRQEPEAGPQVPGQVFRLVGPRSDLREIGAGRNHARRQVHVQEHAHEAASGPEPDLIRADVSPPLPPADQAGRIDSEDASRGRERGRLGARRAGDGARMRRHAEPLVAEPVRNRQIPHASRARRRGQGAQQREVDSRRERTERAESSQGLDPVPGRHEEDVDHQQEPEDIDDHGPGKGLERALDRFPEQEHRKREDQNAAGSDGEDAAVRDLGHPPGDRREGCRRAAGRKGRQAELRHAERGVGHGPEARSGPEAHEAGDDRFPGVERVADGLEIEDELQRDGHRRDPKQAGAVPHRCRGPHQPFPAADRGGQQNGAGADDAEQVPGGEGRRCGQFARFPGGERTHGISAVRAKGLAGAIGPLVHFPGRNRSCGTRPALRFRSRISS